MKKTLFTVCIVLLGALLLTACSSKKNAPLPVPDEEYMDYVGRQFTGKDPWGGALTVTVRSIVDGKMEWTFTDMFDTSTLYQLVEETPVDNGPADFSVQGKDVENKNVTFAYEGKIELKDSAVTVTFGSGSGTTKAKGGDSSDRVAENLQSSGLSDKAVLEEDTSLDTYTVQSGDSIHSIAKAYGITTRELAIMNQTVIIETAKKHGYDFDDVIEYANYLFPGEVLRVPSAK